VYPVIVMLLQFPELTGPEPVLDPLIDKEVQAEAVRGYKSTPGPGSWTSGFL